MTEFTRLPSQGCLTCTDSGVSCDNMLPTCTACRECSARCLKPNLNVLVPWDRTPIRLQQSVLIAPQSLSSDTMSYARNQHKDLIQGLTNFYETLVEMCYIPESALLRSPHPTLPTGKLMELGLEVEVIDLMRHIPYLGIEDEDEIWLDTFHFSYLNQVHVNDARDVLYQNQYDIAPWAIRLTRAKRWGVTLIYDLRSQTITSWPNGLSLYTNTYLDLPSQPALEVLQRWTESFRSLQHIPWNNTYFRSIVLKPGFSPHYIDPEQSGVFTGPFDSDVSTYTKNIYNEYQAKRKLFIDYGWPNAFQSADFIRAREHWITQFEEVSELPEALYSFLKESAGADALI